MTDFRFQPLQKKEEIHLTLPFRQFRSPGHLPSRGFGAEELCIHFLIPTVQFLTHRIHAVGVFVCHIGTLAHILFQIVEMNSSIFESLEQFPITDSNRGSGKTTLVAVMRIMPEQRPRGDFPRSFQFRNQADSITMLFWSAFQTRDFKECGVEFDSDYGCLTNTARFGDTLAFDNERLSNSLFIQAAVASTNWKLPSACTFLF